MRVSLHDIAPRLAVARDVRMHEIDQTGEYPGQDFARVDDFEHSVGRCRFCGGDEDRYEVHERLLVGWNRGQIHRIWRATCRSCGHGTLSNWRRCW